MRTEQKDIEIDQWKTDVVIDQMRLDEEWVKQPATYMRYAKLHAEAQRKVRHIEQQIKVCRSKLLLVAREQGAKNAQQEEAYYRTHPDHMKLKDEMEIAQFDADILMGAVFAMNQKRDALENLVKLHGQSYFAAPQAPEEAKKWAEETERSGTRRKIKERMLNKKED